MTPAQEEGTLPTATVTVAATPLLCPSYRTMHRRFVSGDSTTPLTKQNILHQQLGRVSKKGYGTTYDNQHNTENTVHNVPLTQCRRNRTQCTTNTTLRAQRRTRTETKQSSPSTSIIISLSSILLLNIPFSLATLSNIISTSGSICFCLVCAS